MGLRNILQAFFYATEHSEHHNRVVYYRKKVWDKLCQDALDERSGMFKQVDPVCYFVVVHQFLSQNHCPSLNCVLCEN
jgi:hypothetical protein